MKRLFYQTLSLDKRAGNLGLSNEILMENAANAIAKHIRKKFKKGTKILGIAGSGNNGADVIATLRMLSGDYECELFLYNKKLKELSKFQLDIAKNFGVKIVDDIYDGLNGTKCIIDGIFGTGLNKELDEKSINLIKLLNHTNAYKIACDIPSGLNQNGQIYSKCFKADITITMGARKLGLYSDIAKDYVGTIKVANLGISNHKFEFGADAFLLEKSDMRLPFRVYQNLNKGSFGHAFFIAGELSGAAKLASMAAFCMGAGLVSIISKNKITDLDPSIMNTSKITANMNAGAIGMGLNKQDIDEIDINLLKDKKLVIDAALLRDKKVFEILNKDCVITPHPDEFCSLLALANIANLSIDELQNERFKYAKIWSKKFKGILVLKGANTIIASRGRLFIMDKGINALAKGGSGDVLSGLITSLLAQGFSPLRASITASLAHALCARKFKANNYSLKPQDIIKGIKWLQSV